MALRQLLATLVLLLALLGGPALAQDSAQVEAEPAPSALSQVGDDDLQTAFRRMKRDDTIQFELTSDVPPPPPPPPRWLRWLGEFFGALFEILTPIIIAVFWMGVGALIMVALYAILLAIWGLRERMMADDDGEVAQAQEYRPDARTVRVLLEDADRLAAEGRYAEAVHLLLYRSIQDIEQARPDAIRLSLTAREISRSEALGPDTRTTFASLARVVERSHFGGRAVDAQDYAEARATYEDFTTRGFAAASQAPATAPSQGVTA